MEITLAHTNYLGVTGTDAEARDGLFTANRRLKLRDVRDGTSNTLMVGERGYRMDALDGLDDSEDMTNLRFGMWFSGPGQRHGSAAVVLGVRERNFGHGVGPLKWEMYCPPGPYRFQRPGLIQDATGRINEACDLFHFWSWHTAGGNFCFADGSVRFFTYEMDNLFPALATRSGGETVSLP